MGSGTNWVGSKASNNAASANPKSNQALTDLATQFGTETGGLRNELISQLTDVLKTGGSQSITPTIAKAVESSRQAASKTLQQTDESLALKDLAGTPFGETIRSGTVMSGEQATSQIPANIAQQLIQLIPGFVLGQGQTAMSGLGAGATNETQLANTMMQGAIKSIWMGK